MSDQPPAPATESPPVRRTARGVRNSDIEAEAIDESAVVSSVESDRYCDSCGYNLITLPVFKDPRTNLFLVRCTECGAVHPAGLPTSARPIWVNRLGPPLMFAWMVLIGAFLFITGVISTAMQAVSFEQLTDGRGADRAPYTDFPEFPYFVALVWGASFMMGLVQVTMLSTAAHHWRRWGYFVAAIVLPVIPLAIALQAWRLDAPHLLNDWALRIMLSHYGVALLGGLLGAMFGRKIMRMFASLLLPPKARQMVAFLWLADNLPPPKAPLRQSR